MGRREPVLPRRPARNRRYSGAISLPRRTRTLGVVSPAYGAARRAIAKTRRNGGHSGPTLEMPLRPAGAAPVGKLAKERRVGQKAPRGRSTPDLSCPA